MKKKLSFRLSSQVSTRVNGHRILFSGFVAVLLGLSGTAQATLPSFNRGESGVNASQPVNPVKTFKGVVLDSDGEPLVGVSVLVKGTTTGTVTDMDGNFSVSASPNEVLVFSYIGYTTKEVKCGNQTTIRVVLDSDNKLLDEVVVVGYGTVKKRDLTGSVASVKSEDLKRIPTSNVIEAIQGQVAGLDITKSTGEAGASMSMTLRGNRSINGSNDPLFIIDGMEGSYDELNPNDIVSVEVLKDASSTAVYGAAGANGVIIITTKTPKKDKFSIDLDAYYGWNVITSFPKVNSGEDYINFRREAMKNAGRWNSSEDDANLFPSYLQSYIDAGKWVDWQDMVSQTGTTTSYNLSTSYATDRSTSYFSLGYYDIEGLLKNDELERYSARAKIDFKANDIVKYGLNLYAMYSKNDKRYSRVWNRVLNMVPLGDPYDEEGNVNDYPIEGSGDMSPLADNGAGNYVNNIKTISVTPQVYLELTPLKGLSFKSVLGGYFQNVKQGIYQGAHSYQGLESKKVLAEIPNTLTYNYKWQNILTYNFNINNDHEFTVTGVTEWSKDRKEKVTATANGFDTDSYAYHNLGAATGVPTVSSSYVGSQKMSYVARLNYAYKGRYLLSLSSRWDGSSMLSAGNKWDVFPAGALAWRVSDESFMKDVEAVSNLKLRASYGVTGNAGASEYATLDYSRTGVFGFQDTPVSYSGYNLTVANKNLGWEKSYMWDLGFDLGLLKNRIDVTFDWYRTDTKDILYQKNLPYASGGYGSSPFKTWANVGKTRNTGVELTITSHNIATRDFTWDMTLSFAKNNEKVLKTTSDGPLQFGNYYLIEGQPIHTYYGYKYAGIWGTAEAEEAAKYGQLPGQIHIAENGETNYKLSTDDYYILGNADPKWTGSWLNSFSYKNFDLSVLLIARWKWTIAYGVTGWYRLDGISPSPTICDYWTTENQSARYPAPNADSSQDAYQQWANYFDGSYLKVKNISLGYTLPKNWLKKVNVERARIYVTASNPFIYTKCKYLKDYDPEKGGDDDEAPLSKQFVFGFNISF
jgi:TonB-linked SusC/RagA family outer membrane protein